MKEGKTNDSVLLGGSNTTLFHVVRSRHSINGYKRNIRYGLALYLFFALFSYSNQSQAADTCNLITPLGTPEQTLVDAATAFGTPSFFCMSAQETIDACGLTSSSINLRWTASNGDDCAAFVRLNNTCLSEGLTELPDGSCGAEPDPCESASADNFSQTQPISGNPGLCEVGDTAQATEIICTFSESAVENCEASITNTYTYASSLPLTINLSQTLNFSSTSCDTPTNPVGPTFPDCGDVPPTCPVGQTAVIEIGSGDYICQVPSTTDMETVPDDQTATRETTTTTTSTTTTNPDGSTTTTSTTTTTVGDCPSGQVCDETFDYEGPGEFEVKTFGESLDAFYDTISNAPLVTSLSGISDSVPESSTCPTWDIPDVPLINTTLTIDAHCSIFNEQASTIRTIFLIVFSIIGILIIMSA